MREEEVRELGVPYFKVCKNDTNRYAVTMHNYEQHDNAPRMPFLCHYLQTRVFPNLQNNASGCYPVQLHDSYTHIGADEQNILVFAKDKAHTKPVLLPDPYMIGNYGGRLHVQDPLSWQDKVDKVAFYGVTTGAMDPHTNQRLQTCSWSINHADACDFKITGVVQMREKIVKDAYPNLDAFRSSPLRQDEQYRYKYLLSIDGNTASYDRPAWIMNSHSLLMKYTSKDMLWYYPLMQDGTHFVEVRSPDDILSKRSYFNSNPGHAMFIIQNANNFVRSFLTPTATLLYSTYLFETAAGNAP